MNNTKKITVTKFIAQYNKLEGKAKEVYLKDSLIKTYMNYLDKVTIAQTIITLSCVNQKNKKVEINSAKRYVLSIMFLINSYTNISVDFDKLYTDFDALNKNGLIERFMNNSIGFEIIPTKELTEFQMILDMTMNDFMTNKYESHNFFVELVEIIASALNGKIDSMIPFLENIAKTIENMNEPQRDNFNKKVIEIINKTIK